MIIDVVLLLRGGVCCSQADSELTGETNCAAVNQPILYSTPAFYTAVQNTSVECIGLYIFFLGILYTLNSSVILILLTGEQHKIL